MARQHFQRKDLKRQDEFVTEGLQLVGWARQNASLLAIVGGGVLVVALAFVGFGSIKDARSHQASDDLSEALVGFQAKQYADAAQKLADIGTRWESTNPGRIARLYAADAQIETSSWDAAANLLQALPDKPNWPPYLVQQATLSLGVVAEGKGDNTAAASRYSEAAAMEGPYTAIAILGEARSRERAGQKEEARKLYERFTREFPQAPENDLATAKLESLKS